jgi:hypothetical protein
MHGGSQSQRTGLAPGTEEQLTKRTTTGSRELPSLTVSGGGGGGWWQREEGEREEKQASART